MDKNKKKELVSEWKERHIEFEKVKSFSRYEMYKVVSHELKEEKPE